MNNETWVLVSDACRTRIFADLGMRSGLVELEGFTCPGAREHIKELVLTAPPHFLGLLRNALGGTLSKCVVASLDKDYTTLEVQELSARIHGGVWH
ncbi:host attachment protein [Holophaga foetida]|uniref:host attachment protein n=1 Tax=Holophaga foetida TaxID=35839 RepID=UPI000247371D|nr:host attachment protein [Holophaga foetida]